MLKIRVLGVVAAFGLLSLVGCNPAASTALDKAKDVAKDVAKDAKDKVKEGTDKAKEGLDKAKEGLDKLKDTFTKLKETYDKDLAVIGDKLKELGKKKDAAKGVEEIKALGAQFTEANGLMEKIKEAMKGFNLESLKDLASMDAIKAKIEPLIAELKKKLGIN